MVFAFSRLINSLSFTYYFLSLVNVTIVPLTSDCNLLYHIKIRYMTRSELALKVLETIGRAATDAATLIEAVLSSPYGASLSRLESEVRRIERRNTQDNRAFRDRQRLYDLLYRLQRDGFIQKNIIGKKRIWRLTLKGKQETNKIRKYFASSLPKKSYQKGADEELKIIVFDVP